MVAALAFVVGSAVGSFLNVVVDRVPPGGSLFRPRSHCGSCGTPLRTIDLIPVISYLLIRGRCRYCRASVPARLLAVEAMTAAVFLGSYLRYGATSACLSVAVASALLILLAASALETGRALTHALVVGGIAAVAVAPFWTELGIPRGFGGDDGFGWSGANSVLGGGIVLATAALAYATRVVPARSDGVAVSLMSGLVAGMPGALIAAGAIALTVAFVYASGLRGKGSASDRRPVLLVAASALGALPALLIGSSTWP